MDLYIFRKARKLIFLPTESYGTFVVSTKKNATTRYWLSSSLAGSNVPGVRLQWNDAVESYLIQFQNLMKKSVSQTPWQRSFRSGISCLDTQTSRTAALREWRGAPSSGCSSVLQSPHRLLLLGFPRIIRSALALASDLFTVWGWPKWSVSARFDTPTVKLRAPFAYLLKRHAHMSSYCPFILPWISANFRLLCPRK